MVLATDRRWMISRPLSPGRSVILKVPYSLEFIPYEGGKGKPFLWRVRGVRGMSRSMPSTRWMVRILQLYVPEERSAYL